MPAFLEDKLKKEAKKKGFSGDRADKYVYGTMNNLGAMRGSQVTEKGKQMEAKHQLDAVLASKRRKGSHA